MDGKWSPVGTPNADVEQTVATVRTVLAQLKNDGWQVLLYPGKNRTMVMASKGSKVHLITEAVDG